VGRKALGEGRQPGVARLAVVRRGADLDQFVGGEGPIDLGDHLFGEALVADDHDRGEGVGFGAQLAASFGGKWTHRGGICKRP